MRQALSHGTHRLAPHMAKLGIGVLSLAHGHIQSYCAEIQGFDDADVVSCWDDDAARGSGAAERYGMAYVDTPEAVVNDDRVDAVMIGVETYRHAEMVRLAAQAGKHILLQKPMALTLEDCDQIIADVDDAGVLFSKK